MRCVDLGESFQTHIYLQKLASIHPRTSPLGGLVWAGGVPWTLGRCQRAQTNADRSVVGRLADAAENETCKVCPLSA